jgi:ATP-GRASP peptide maturase of grasp-with-spasm system
MLLILSEESDYSTSKVIDWLLFYKIKFIRVNKEDIINLEFKNDDIIFSLKNNKFLLSNIKCFWYRRGFINLNVISTLNKEIDNFLLEEISNIREYIYYKLNCLPNINSFFNSNVNKLIVLDIARKIGLNSPSDYLVNSKIDLKRFINKNIEFSTKSITGLGQFTIENKSINLYTKKITNKTYKNTPKTFFPSLVQNYIDKKYELRIYFLHNKMWTMAIFSQKDNKTSTDFRIYNKTNPNINVPFTLPSYIEEKIIKLMNELKLNSGSIDMIVNKNNEYFF